MTNVVITTEGLSKKYRRGVAASSGLLRDTLARVARSPMSVFRSNRQPTFWALKDVSMQVHEGEVLGLIGRNGSGKTTLLKILSRITRPTHGWAEIHGRVSCLLEVGTGFHPELTGRENTFLSGAILGMSKQEISRKFDEIVGFAELEEFIDTPVKHYSSGMYVRLAFAVAAHLEPEILIVDEVLAVGDIKFQKKCLGKMDDAARTGRTVILVSHQLNQIRRLCQRAIWLDGGVLRSSGPTGEIVSAYESAMSSNELDTVRSSNGPAQFIRWKLSGPSSSSDYALASDGKTSVSFFVRVNSTLRGVHHGIGLYDQSRNLLWGNAVDGITLNEGIHELRHTLPSLPLRPGTYSWRSSIYDAGERVDDWECLPQMHVITVPLAHPRDEWAGFLNISSEFEIL
jgi:lipopolysaccharide transport system ATP-binding protein